MTMNLRDTHAGVDKILTTIAQGYTLPENSIANFVAPVVETPTRAGRVLRFGKESFAVGDYTRALGANIKYTQSRYDSTPFALKQEILGWEIPEETIQEAEEGPAEVDLVNVNTKDVLKKLTNSYENQIAEMVTDHTAYEPKTADQLGLGYETMKTFYDDAKTLNIGAGGGTAAVGWDATGDSGANPIRDVLVMNRAVANHIGVRPNSMVMGSAVYDALMVNEKIIDRIQYTTKESVTTDSLARYFTLSRGIKVAEGRKLDGNGLVTPIFPENAILLFYSPLAPSQSIMPATGSSMATPAFAYTYQLKNTPNVRPQYYVKERRVVRAEVTVERMVAITGLGATGKYGSGFMIKDVFNTTTTA